MVFKDSQRPAEKLETQRMYLRQVQVLLQSLSLGYPGGDLEREEVLKLARSLKSAIEADIQRSQGKLNSLFGIGQFDLSGIEIMLHQHGMGPPPALDKSRNPIPHIRKEEINQNEIKYFKCEAGCGKSVPEPGICNECLRARRSYLRSSLLSEELKPIIDCIWCSDGRDLAFGESCSRCPRIGKFKTID